MPVTLPPTTLDFVLSRQIAVAWAGEKGEEPRLGWWRTELVSEFGGEDLFRHLLPATWRWATFQAAREAARRKDAELRARSHDPDRLLTLFRLGFEIDERLEERLQELKQSSRDPRSLPTLGDLVQERWDPAAFADWVAAHGTGPHQAAPVGRRLQGAPPESLELLVEHLVGALAPLGDTYPLPHYRTAA